MIKYLSKISQAVILAGGRGSRLHDLTDNIPKPMIPIHGKPFLEYIIEMLAEEGITEILLLLGYLPEKIKGYFQDGKKWGVKISYSVSCVENKTGMRLRLVNELLDHNFLLLYCDNYWPININRLWNNYIENQAIAQVVVYSNSDNYSTNNVLVDNKGYIEVYDSSRNYYKLNGVDIGFIIANKEVIDLLPAGNVSFEKYVYPQLVERKQLLAFKTDQKYYSIGDKKRLPMTSEYLREKKGIILDRDGVLNVKPDKADYVKSWEEFTWISNAKESISLLTEYGYQIIIITNQAGIARGKMSESDLNIIHQNMIKDIEDLGGEIDAIYYCPHGWDDDCDCRKPKPGMLLQAKRDFRLNFDKTYFVGDDIRDEEAGKSAGCKTILVSKDESLFDIVKNKIIVQDEVAA